MTRSKASSTRSVLRKRLAGSRQVAQFTLAPVASGFTADRRPFCLNTRKAPSGRGTIKFFNSGANGTNDGASQLANATFCPDVNSTDASDAGPIARNAQKVYPNMLFSSLIRGALLYVPNIGAQPDPPYVSTSTCKVSSAC